jgi:hypothetical protein
LTPIKLVPVWNKFQFIETFHSNLRQIDEGGVCMIKAVRPISFVIVAGILFGGGYFLGDQMPNENKVMAETNLTATTSTNLKEDPKQESTSTAIESAETSRIDQEILPYLGTRNAETKTLLDHSRKVIDAYLIGTSEAQSAGDFLISPDQTATLLNSDYERFRALFADELKRGNETAKELETYTDGPLPWNKHKDKALLQVVLRIDEAYSGAIDNLAWSNTEPNSEGIDEQKEYDYIRELDAKTRFMTARDILQRYSTWMFGGTLDVDGVTRVK